MTVERKMITSAGRPRTSNYIATINMKDPEDLKWLEYFRKNTKIVNKYYRNNQEEKQIRVSLKHRLGKNNPNRSKYNFRRQSNVWIKEADATYTDVYLHQR